MFDKIDQSVTTTKTFLFGSGQILTLDEDQIEKIPYLATLTSAAAYFNSICDEHGYYKLDPHIDYEDFLFVLESLSFHSVRQIFTHLPKENDVIPIIALIDFLGLGPRSVPTLNEVDSTFFATLMYSPMLGKQLQIVRPYVIQDMAVRFTISIVKEEYDFSNDQVMDQIYWFITFILSAYEYFGSRLRHHVYRIAENYFSLFKQSLLMPLKKLIHRTEKNLRTLGFNTNDMDVEHDEENQYPLERHVILNDCYTPCKYNFRWYGRLKKRQDLVLYHTHINYDWPWYSSILSEIDHLKPVYERILEIMYERLQSEICQRSIIELRKSLKSSPCVQQRNDSNSQLYLVFKHKALPKTIENLFRNELIQEEIRKHILEDLDILIPKLKNRYVELMKELKEYEQNLQRRNHTELSGIYSLSPSRFSKLQTMRKHISSYELILNKLEQESTMIEEIQQHVIDRLYTIALKRFNQWKKTQNDINKLYHSLSPCLIGKTVLPVKSKHQLSVNKSLTKHQLKYIWRR